MWLELGAYVARAATLFLEGVALCCATPPKQLHPSNNAITQQRIFSPDHLWAGIPP
jgi:hypothetical protein